MDKRKQQMLQKKQQQEQKAKENNPAYKYINNSDLDAPKLFRLNALNDYSAVDDKLEKLWIEVSIMEEQTELKKRLDMDIARGETVMKTPDGSRLLTVGEMKTQRRICDITAYQSKVNVEKVLTDMIQLVGVPLTEDTVILTEEEHNDIVMTVVNRVGKLGYNLFQSNRKELLSKLKGN